MSLDPPASGSFPQAPPAPSLVGEVLDGRYKVIKKLGEGGMGEVYAAEHVHIEKRFAVKLLKAEIVSNPEAVKRFQQEARSSSSIKHRNIIGVEDFGRLPDGRIYMCMELLDGAPLNEMIQQPSMTADRLLNILIQSGHGLAAAHAKGIVHRDMKPENIFVTHEGQNDVPKLLDFGIAKVAGNEGQNNLTRTGTIFGTPFYMAPEQALGNPVDPRTDVYAMGVIMYECFAGSVPFLGESFMGILTQHITTDAEPVVQRAAKIGRHMPPGVADIITKCMQKTPAHRFQTMDELVNALIAIYRGVAGPGMSTYMEAFPVGSAQHTSQPTPPPMSGHRTGNPMGGPQHGGMPSAGSQTVGVGTPPPYHQGHQSQPPPYQSQPVMPVAHGHAPSGQGYAIGHQSGGLYDPGSSSVAAVKKGNTGVIIAILVLLAAGGGIAAVVLLGGKKAKQDDVAAGGSDSGSQVAVNEAGSGSAVTPDIKTGSNTDTTNAGTGTPNLGSATTTTNTGSAQGSANDTGSAEGSAAVVPDKGSAAVVPDAPKTVGVLLISNAQVFEVWEDGKKVLDGPDNVQIVPGTPRKFTIKAKGYKDKAITVDGKQTKVTTKLSRVPGQTTTTTTNTTTTTPTKDCSKAILDPSSSTCRAQYCKSHKSDARCETLDDD